VGIWWSKILGLVLSAWAVRSPLHSADSNFGRILTTDLPPPGYARHERPGRGAANKCDEVASSHSITSSARASRVGGTSRPSDLAVLRLITKSTLLVAPPGHPRERNRVGLQNWRDIRRAKVKVASAERVPPVAPIRSLGRRALQLIEDHLATLLEYAETSFERLER